MLTTTRIKKISRSIALSMFISVIFGGVGVFTLVGLLEEIGIELIVYWLFEREQ